MIFLYSGMTYVPLQIACTIPQLTYQTHTHTFRIFNVKMSVDNEISGHSLPFGFSYAFLKLRRDIPFLKIFSEAFFSRKIEEITYAFLNSLFCVFYAKLRIYEFLKFSSFWLNFSCTYETFRGLIIVAHLSLKQRVNIIENCFSNIYYLVCYTISWNFNVS